MRDARIAGNMKKARNHIQAQDLLKRKVLANGGRWIRDFILDIEQDVQPALFLPLKKTLY